LTTPPPLLMPPPPLRLAYAMLRLVYAMLRRLLSLASRRTPFRLANAMLTPPLPTALPCMLRCSAAYRCLLTPPAFFAAHSQARNQPVESGKTKTKRPNNVLNNRASLITASSNKHEKHGATARLHACKLFGAAIDTYGAFHDDLLQLLKLIANHSASPCSPPSRTAYLNSTILTRVSVAAQKGIADVNTAAAFPAYQPTQRQHAGLRCYSFDFMCICL
jgi:hypothetical protein